MKRKWLMNIIYNHEMCYLAMFLFTGPEAVFPKATIYRKRKKNNNTVCVSKVKTQSEPFMVMNKTEKTNLSSNEFLIHLRMTTVKGCHTGTHLPCPKGEGEDLAGDPLDAGSQGEE